MKGRVVRISATSIDLLVNDGSREWAASDVARITQRRGHAVLGAVVGLAVGVGSGGTSRPHGRRMPELPYEGCGREDAADVWFSGPSWRHWRRRRCGNRRCDQTGACPVRGAESSVGACVLTPRGAGRNWDARPTPVLTTTAPYAISRIFDLRSRTYVQKQSLLDATQPKGRRYWDAALNRLSQDHSAAGNR